MKKHVIPLMLAGLLGTLAACGGGNHSTPPPTVDVPLPAPPTQPPPTAVDKFFALVAGIVASMADDAEPVALDDSAPTAPDNTEPQAVTP